MKHKWLLFLIIPLPVLADGLLMSDIPNGCSPVLNNAPYLVATFTPNQYTCNPGYYLPANNAGCVACPGIYDCSGGTFYFNPYINHGNSLKSQISSNIANGCVSELGNSVLIATFIPNGARNCNPGYYLPATTDECTKCLNDHYCPGGTYNFDETTAQGINQCPSEHPFAPVGMWLQSQCGRKLHLGGNVIYMHQSPANPTNHRLFVRMNNYVYSANTTEKQPNTPDKKMSNGMSQSLHVSLDGVEYLVHDDSVE